MSRTSVSVTAVIPAFGRADAADMVRFLRQNPCEGVDLYAIVIDNGNGPELSAELARAAGDDCRVIRLEENRGGAGAFRVGMLEAAGRGTDSDFVWLLDDDAELNPGTLPGLLAEFRRLEGSGVRIGCIGSVQLGQLQRDKVADAGGRLSPITGRYLRAHTGESANPLPDWTDLVWYAAATSLLAKTQVVREVGPFEDVFIHGDDIDWGYRVREAGWGVYVTSRSVIRHMEWEAKPADWIVYYDVRNLMWCLRRHLPFAACIAWLLRRCQQTVCALHGRRSIVRLMNLGFRHAATGELLLRSELPPPPRWISIGEALGGRTRAAVLMYRSADVGKWQQRLRGISCDLLACTGRGPKAVSYFRTALRQLWVQCRLLLHPDTTVFVDCSCVKRYPVPLFAKNKVFYWETPDAVLIFREPEGN